MYSFSLFLYFHYVRDAITATWIVGELKPTEDKHRSEILPKSSKILL